MKLVAGSYERFLWGWQVKEKPPCLDCVFSYPAHLGPIRCIAGCGSVVATGGADDTIRVFDINAMSDKGSLIKHAGAITCLAFYGTATVGPSSVIHPTHLLSGSEDGTICIWDTDAWIHLKTLKGGKKTTINDLTIHPSGRVAFSVDRDSHLRMWNLMKGRCSFSAKLPSEASLIQIAPQEGDFYALARESVVDIYNSEDGRATQSLQHEKRVLCMAMHQKSFVVTAGEGATVQAWDLRTGKVACAIAKAHTNRIKGVCLLGRNRDSASDELPEQIASASSDGLVRVWDVRAADKSTALMESATKSRLTSLISCGTLRKNVRAEIGKYVADSAGAAPFQELVASKAPTQQKKAIQVVKEDSTTPEKTKSEKAKKAGKRKPKAVVHISSSKEKSRAKRVRKG